MILLKMTGARILVEVLIEQGVRDVFGYPGGQAINIYDQLYLCRDRINHILTAHEQGAAHAADGYARATGKTGVVIATSGPGATNLVTGIATAMLDSSPPCCHNRKRSPVPHRKGQLSGNRHNRHNPSHNKA